MISLHELEEQLKARTIELQQANEAAELYLDLMGHDINNLNHIALGYLEMASLKLDLSTEEKELIEKPREAIAASSKLIGDLRSLRLVIAGEIECKIMDLDTILSQSLATSRINGFMIKYTGQPGSIIMGNDLLIETFTSIILSIIRGMEVPAWIDITLSSQVNKCEKYYRVTIENHEPSVLYDFINRLFTPWKAGQPTRGTKDSGLYLAKRVIESCGGTISIEERIEGDPGKGWRFVVILPALNKLH